MKFSTPLRDKVEEHKKQKSVFVSDRSITQSNNPTNLLENSVLPTTTIMTNIGARTDELVPYTTGMSTNSDNSKKYKLFIVDDAKAICGTVMGQGITFCLEYNCQVKHRGVNKVLQLEEDHIYVAQ